MSAAARSRILMHAEADTPIPAGWALDREGHPTTNAREAAGGLLLPMGGHKGFGMALMWDALAGVLSGARFGTEVVRPQVNEPGDIGHFMLAIDVRFFGDSAAFRRKIDRVARTIRDTAPQAEDMPVHVPGENSHAMRVQHRAGGIPLTARLVDRLNGLAEQYGIVARISSTPG